MTKRVWIPAVALLGAVTGGVFGALATRGSQPLPPVMACDPPPDTTYCLDVEGTLRLRHNFTGTFAHPLPDVNAYGHDALAKP